MPNDLANQLPDKIRRKLTPVGVHKTSDGPAGAQTCAKNALLQDSHRKEVLRAKAKAECDRVRLVHSKVRENEAVRRAQVLRDRNSRLKDAQKRRETVIQKRRFSAHNFALTVLSSMDTPKDAQSDADQNSAASGPADVSRDSENAEPNQPDSEPAQTPSEPAPRTPNTLKSNSTPSTGSSGSLSSSENLEGSLKSAPLETLLADIAHIRELSPLVQFLLLDSPIPTTEPSSPPGSSFFPEDVIKYVKSLVLQEHEKQHFPLLLMRELKGDGIRSTRSASTRISSLLVHLGVPCELASGHILIMALSQMLKITSSDMGTPWNDSVALARDFRDAVGAIKAEKVPRKFAAKFCHHFQSFSSRNQAQDSRINKHLMHMLAQQVALVPLLAREFRVYGRVHDVVGQFNEAFERLAACILPRRVLQTAETLREARLFASRALYVAIRSPPHNLTYDTYVEHMEQLRSWVNHPSFEIVSDDLSLSLGLHMKRSRRMNDEYASAAFYSQFFELFRGMCVPSSTKSALFGPTTYSGVVFTTSDCRHMIDFTSKHLSQCDKLLEEVEDLVPEDLVAREGLQSPFFCPFAKIDMEMLILTRMKVDRPTETMHKFDVEETYFTGYSGLGEATMRFAHEFRGLFERFSCHKQVMVTVQWKYWFFIFVIRGLCDLVPARDDYHVKLFDYLTTELEAQVTNHAYADNGTAADDFSAGGTCDSFNSRVLLEKILNCLVQFACDARQDRVSELVEKMKSLDDPSHDGTGTIDSDHWFDKCVAANYHISLYLTMSQMMYDTRVAENIPRIGTNLFSTTLQREHDHFNTTKRTFHGLERLIRTVAFVRTSFETQLTKCHPGDVRNESSCAFHDPLLVGFAKIIFSEPNLDLAYGYAVPESFSSILRFVITCQIETRSLILTASILLHTSSIVHTMGYKLPVGEEGIVLRTGRLHLATRTPRSLAEGLMELIFANPKCGDSVIDEISHFVARKVDLKSIIDDSERMRIYSNIFDKIRASIERVIALQGSDGVGTILRKRITGTFLSRFSRGKNVAIPPTVSAPGFEDAVSMVCERMGIVWKTHYETHGHGYLSFLYLVHPDLKPSVITRVRCKAMVVDNKRKQPGFR